jgi:hypothetical protein
MNGLLTALVVVAALALLLLAGFNTDSNRAPAARP